LPIPCNGRRMSRSLLGGKHNRCWRGGRRCSLGGRRIRTGWRRFLGLRRWSGLTRYRNTLDEQARSQHEQKRCRLGPESPSTASKPVREPGSKNFCHPLTPLAARKRATAAGTTAPPEPHWGASLPRSPHPDYFVLAANAASQFAEDQTDTGQEVFFGV
jgi:hypothetical protein